jgi:hypothetical protein
MCQASSNKIGFVRCLDQTIDLVGCKVEKLELNPETVPRRIIVSALRVEECEVTNEPEILGTNDSIQVPADDTANDEIGSDEDVHVERIELLIDIQATVLTPKLDRHDLCRNSLDRNDDHDSPDGRTLNCWFGAVSGMP